MGEILVLQPLQENSGITMTFTYHIFTHPPSKIIFLFHLTLQMHNYVAPVEIASLNYPEVKYFGLLIFKNGWRIDE
jgi:hypothetical protein